ncbi:phosphoglycerol geranylgeranyltransferase [Cnuella takakiae]|nr:geranylgeranylglyceryl/heptaprenylglyceryl phosphate synthase [Cnuella takakiae]
MPLYPALMHLKAQRRKALAVLVDPDKADETHLSRLVELAVTAGVDYFFVGGSLLLSGRLEATVQAIKVQCTIPVVLFPGAATHLTPAADALLYLSLISGRNPELLIGQQVLSAPGVKRSGLEVLSTGYMLVDGGAPTTVSYISNTTPLPHNKSDIAVSTALAGELLGMKLIFIDAGSGAPRPVPTGMIHAVAAQIGIPLVVGGGIRTPQQAYDAAKAGADIVVVGNVLEEVPELLPELAAAVNQASGHLVGAG